MSKIFQENDRVILTPFGQNQFPKAPFTGTVVSKNRGTQNIRVKMDGRKTAQSWPVTWFDRLEATP